MIAADTKKNHHGESIKQTSPPVSEQGVMLFYLAFSILLTCSVITSSTSRNAAKK